MTLRPLELIQAYYMSSKHSGKIASGVSMTDDRK